MPCESCSVQFSVFRRKRVCPECDRYYCSGCLRRGGGVICAACRVLCTRPLSRQSVGYLKVRDLQCFLNRQNVSTRHCVEKEDLISLVVQHVNSSAYRRRTTRPTSGAFSSLKGFTNNINELFNSAFEVRPPNAHPTRNEECYNSSHVHNTGGPPPRPRAAPTSPPAAAPPPQRTAPASDVRYVPPPQVITTSPDGETSPTSPQDVEPQELRDTADCYEIEDLDDTGWEFVTRPANPLPNDSEVLLEETHSTPQRAASALELRTAGPGLEADAERGRGAAEAEAGEEGARGARAERGERAERADRVSLQDEPSHSPAASSRRIDLDALPRQSDLELLNVKQLKDLLTMNRVDYKDCLERRELLERAKLLWSENDKSKEALERLPLEQSCKICMAAPLECVLLECGHIAACTACGKRLAECPICRRYVVRAVRFFRS